MGTFVHRFVIAATLVAIPGAVPAAAQPAPAAVVSSAGMTMTPFMALGDDLAPGGGVSFSFPLAGRFALEAEASAGTDALRSGLSVLFDVARFGGFTTYVAGGAGVQRDEVPGTYFPGRFPSIERKTEFALGIGAGATIPVGPRWSYRADFRWYNPKAEWPESWRVYNGLTFRLTQ